MSKIGINATRTHLPVLLERAARGESFTITRQGVAVAILGPPEPSRPRDLSATVTALKAFRQRHTLDPTALHSLIDAGRCG